MSVLENRAQPAAEATPIFAASVQELMTRGYTRLDQCLSERLLHKIATASAQRLDGRYVRQIYDGLPARIVERLIGRAVLSKVQHGLSPDWHRGRTDVTASGAPRDFLPGIDLIVALEGSPLTVDVVGGSGRLRDDEPIPFAFAARVEVEPQQVLLLDCRLYRRRHAGSPSCLALSVVRSWIVPEQRFAEADDPATPPRAADFFGRASAPSRDLAQWLARTHPKRS
jgi:hypothetical protein